MTDLPARLLAAIDAVEAEIDAHIREWNLDPDRLDELDFRGPTADNEYNAMVVGVGWVMRICAAHRRIVTRYTEAVEWAAKAAPAGGLRSAAAEVRVNVLAEVLDDLAAAYGVTR